jgi:aryl-alcohol dehydrogenase-like predicted oxidoreductase
MLDRICIGTAQFGMNYGISNSKGQTPKKEVFKILDFAQKNQIAWLDTAENYGNSQTIIGEYLRFNEGSFRVQSKISSETLDINRTLNELQIDYIDSYLFHSYNQFKINHKNIRTKVLNLKKEGVCKAVGISIYNNEEGTDQELLRFADEVQFPFNLLDNYNRRKDLIHGLESKNIKIQTRSIFLQGLILLSNDAIPKRLNGAKVIVDQLEKIALRNRLTKSQLAIAYTFSYSFADKILMGVETLNQFKENLIFIRRLKDISREFIHEIESLQIVQTKLLDPNKW